MELFIKASEILSGLSKEEIKSILKRVTIRIDNTRGGHNYGNTGDILAIELDELTVVKLGKDTTVLNALYMPKEDTHGNNIDISQFSIFIDSIDTIKLIREILNKKKKEIEISQEVCDDLENYLKRCNLPKININNYLSYKISEILDNTEDVTERTDLLVKFMSKKLSI